MTPQSSLSIFAALRDFVAAQTGDRITIRALVTHTGEHGLMFLLLIFALFCAIPLPIPGIHIFLAMPLFYVTTQIMVGRKTIWFPDQILNATLPRTGFVALVERAEPWFDRMDNWLRPRLVTLTGPATYQLLGAVTFFITCIIVIPLPLTNVVPALSIALIALGAQCRDGLAVLVGMATGMLWCLAWLALAAFLGWAGMKGIYGLIFS